MITESIDSNNKAPMHVDEFIDYGSDILAKNCPENEPYARWVLNHFRLPAISKSVFDPFMKGNKLFCDHNGKRYRVTGASRMGDVWLTKDFNKSSGYQLRISVDTLSNWSPNP